MTTESSTISSNKTPSLLNPNGGEGGEGGSTPPASLSWRVAGGGASAATTTTTTTTSNNNKVKGNEEEGDESPGSEDPNSDLRSTISTVGGQSAEALADSLTHSLALGAAGVDEGGEEGESTVTGASSIASGASTGGPSWSLYVSKYLTRERAVEINQSVPLEKAMLAAVVKAIGESNWMQIPLDIQLNVIYGYVDDVKDPVGAAVECAKTIHAWRTKNNVNEMLRTGPLPGLQQLMIAWPTRVAGEDVFGHPIIYDKLALIDVKKILEINDNDFLRLRTQVLEALMHKKHEIADRRGHRVGKHVYILDLGGLVISKHFSQAVQKKLRPIMKLSSAVFPETLWTLWLVNTPASFRLVWSAVRAWLDPVVRNKVRMFGSASKWIPAMAQTGIPIEALPTEYGGRVQGETFIDILTRCCAQTKGGGV